MPILSKASNVEPNVFFRDGVPYWDISAVAESQLTDAAKRISAAGPLEKPACR